MKIRKESDRGFINMGWLEASHTFSFGSFFDPDFMGFKSLRVINNDVISPSSGFETHSHRNMEILSFILKGSLEHKDTMGNHSVIEPGEIQLMSAGSGVQHSEFNPSEASDTELFQIWIQPNKENTKPRYQQFTYAKRVVRNKPLLIASSEANENTVLLYQDVAIFSCMFAKDFNFDVVNRGSSYWIQMISGEVAIGELHLLGRDGAGFEKEELQSITARQDSEFLLFEFKE